MSDRNAMHGLTVNDIHSQLNETKVFSIATPKSAWEVALIVRNAKDKGRAISIAGGRHAMGGQQFGTDTILIDMKDCKKIVDFNESKGLLTVEAGIVWSDIISFLAKAQKGKRGGWAIVQKQTGADRLSIGGTLSANGHGRGLRFKPVVQDVEEFTLIDSHGRTLICSRTENRELFSLAIGGYGLFGVIVSARLRLKKREWLQRVVEVIDVKDLLQRFRERIANNFLYGDFQFMTDNAHRDFLTKGVFSCYKPVREDAISLPTNKSLSERDWAELYYLAHTNKTEAFKKYSEYYLSTSGQIYDSDEHQLSYYSDNYHERLDARLRVSEKATEMITEVYIPRDQLSDYMTEVAEDFHNTQVNVIYGTVRLIEKDDESFLAWAKESYACIVFNLHIIHNSQGVTQAIGAFRRLIDYALKRGGGFFLTYHRWATRKQVETCYPQFTKFLQMKNTYDPDGRFQNDWFRHYEKMFIQSL